MLVKVFTLAFDKEFGGFDDSVVAEFLRNKDVLSISEHFFVGGETPYLTFVIKYHSSTNERIVGTRAKTDESWREKLTEADLRLFEDLRAWRGKRCREEGVPPYVLFTNKQLAEIAKLRPSSSTELAQIEGLGRSKLEKYGSDLIGLTASAPSGALQ